MEGRERGGEKESLRQVEEWRADGHSKVGMGRRMEVRKVQGRGRPAINKLLSVSVLCSYIINDVGFTCRVIFVQQVADCLVCAV